MPPPRPPYKPDWSRDMRRILLRYVLPVVATAVALALLFLHYISRVSLEDLQSGTGRSLLFAAIVVGAALFALTVGVSVRLLLNRWIRLLLADIRARRFLDDAESAGDSAPILMRVREAMREVSAPERESAPRQEETRNAPDDRRDRQPRRRREREEPAPVGLGEHVPAFLLTPIRRTK
jgi:hypothetical protein